MLQQRYRLTGSPRYNATHEHHMVARCVLGRGCAGAAHGRSHVIVVIDQHIAGGGVKLLRKRMPRRFRALEELAAAKRQTRAPTHTHEHEQPPAVGGATASKTAQGQAQAQWKDAGDGGVSSAGASRRADAESEERKDGREGEKSNERKEKARMERRLMETGAKVEAWRAGAMVIRRKVCVRPCARVRVHIHTHGRARARAHTHTPSCLALPIPRVQGSSICQPARRRACASALLPAMLPHAQQCARVQVAASNRRIWLHVYGKDRYPFDDSSTLDLPTPPSPAQPGGNSTKILPPSAKADADVESESDGAGARLPPARAWLEARWAWLLAWMRGCRLFDALHMGRGGRGEGSGATMRGSMEAGQDTGDEQFLADVPLLLLLAS
jgi:hypothetical protein